MGSRVLVDELGLDAENPPATLGGRVQVTSALTFSPAHARFGHLPPRKVCLEAPQLRSDAAQAAPRSGRLHRWGQQSSRPAVPLDVHHFAEQSAGLCVVGGGEGAFEAALELVGHLPREIDVPILLSLHGGEQSIAEAAAWLDSVGGPPVVRASPGLRLTPGAIYLAPADGALYVEAGRCRVHARTEFPLDVLLKSAALAAGSATVGAVLSGAGSDGLVGAKALCWAGASVLVQSPESATSPELPTLIIESGYASMVKTPSGLGSLIGRRVLGGLERRRGAA